MIICTVLTGTKYSVADVNNLYNSLIYNTTIKFDFLCYTDYQKGFHKDIIIKPITTKDKKLQWYKLDFFKAGFTDYEDIITMDIDLDIVGNVDFIFDNYSGFVGTHRWWWTWREDRLNMPIALSGTMYKFKNGEHENIVNTFESDIDYWQEYFIKNGVTNGPVNGEQHFVQQMLIDSNTKFSYFPAQHIIKWNKKDSTMQLKLENAYERYTNNEFIDDQVFDSWHPDIRIVHYAGS